MHKSPATPTAVADRISDADELRPSRYAQREFAKRLAARLKELGISQSEAARRIGIGRDNFTGYLKNGTLPRPSRLLQIAQALECSPADLLPPPPAPAGDRPTFEARYLGGGMMMVRMHMRMPIAAAMAILQIVERLPAVEDALASGGDSV